MSTKKVGTGIRVLFISDCQETSSGLLACCSHLLQFGYSEALVDAADGFLYVAAAENKLQV